MSKDLPGPSNINIVLSSLRVKARRDKDYEMLENLRKERLVNKKQKIEAALGQLDDVLISKEFEALAYAD